MLQEFFRPALHPKLYDSVEALQADLEAWLHHYNRERPTSATATGAADQGIRSTCSSLICTAHNLTKLCRA